MLQEIYDLDKNLPQDHDQICIQISLFVLTLRKFQQNTLYQFSRIGIINKRLENVIKRELNLMILTFIPF